MTPPSITVRMNLESVCRLVFAGRRLRASSRNPSIAEVQPSKLSARRLWTRAATTRAKGNEKRETAGADGIAARANGTTTAQGTGLKTRRYKYERNHSEWSVAIGSRRMARRAGM